MPCRAAAKRNTRASKNAKRAISSGATSDEAYPAESRRGARGRPSIAKAMAERRAVPAAAKKKAMGPPARAGVSAAAVRLIVPQRRGHARHARPESDAGTDKLAV